MYGLLFILSSVALLTIVCYICAKWREENPDVSIRLTRNSAIILWFGIIVTMSYNTMIEYSTVSQTYLLIHASVFIGLAILVTKIIEQDR